LTCLDITVSAGTVAFTNTGTITVSGSMSLLAGTTWGGSMGLVFNATTTGKTITTNGVAVGSMAFDGAGGGWTLGSALNAPTGTISVVRGTFDTSSIGNYSITASSLGIGGGTAVRTVNLNASTLTLSSGFGAFAAQFLANLTFNVGTSQINFTSASAGINIGSGIVFYNVAFTSTTAGTRSITASATFNNLSVTAPSSAGLVTFTFAANQTINGTLSTTGTAGNRRVFFASSTYGIGRTLTVNSAPSLTDADFRDLYVIGTAAPISGTRIGDLRGCSGITFSTPKTVYWNQLAGGSWSDNAWAPSSGGGVSTDNFPLAQDTATIVNTGLNTGATITWDVAISYLGSIDMLARTNAMALFFSTSRTVYGDWTNGSGTTVTNNGGLTFSGRNTQTVTSAGKVMASAAAFIVDTYGGTVQLADALNLGTNSLVVTNGTFNTAGFAVTAGVLSSNNSNVRTINLGASVVNLNPSGVTAITFTTSTNLSFNAGTSEITVLYNTSGSIGFQFGGQVYNNVTLSNFSSGSLNIFVNGQNTFNNLTLAGTSASTNIQYFTFPNNQTINGTLTCAGASAVQRIFLQSSSIGTQRNLTVGTLVADDCDFRDIVLAGAAAGASPTRAGDCGGNSGITFPAPKTVYWNLAGAQSWSSTAWCTGSGGTPAVNNFPLAQDTAVFDNGAVSLVTINTDWVIGTFDASAQTNVMTLTTSTNTPSVHGDWKFGTGITSTSTSGAITFAKNGTQTITSNGVQFGCPITINNSNAYVQLADALSLGATRALALTGGTFDAVTYNVTTGSFSNGATANTLKMGSGTWTLSGTGTVWNALSFPPTLIAGTSTIVLSDTTAASRLFASGSFYYNKLTIGGTTGTSTLTINGGNTFGELASTKTVAHTILFQSGAIQNIGKWSVTGTVGNVVTIGPTTAASIYSLTINGPANTGIDYLSVSYCVITSTSPGELYVGANSINTAGNTGAIIFTATPASRNLYWVGGTGNWSSTTKWATSSGGVSGAAIPTSLDTVTFDSMSNPTAYTATIDAGVTIARCAAFSMAGPLTGNVTWAGSVPIAFHGNVSFAATGITRTYTGAMNWAGNSSYTFTTNGLSLSNATTVIGIGSTWTLGSALIIGVTSAFTVTYGTFSTSASNYALNGQAFSSSNNNIRSINLNGSTITKSGTFPFSVSSTNLTFNAGTSTIASTSVSAPSTFSGGNQTFYNVSFTSIGSTIAGTNTFNNLTFAGLTSVGITTVTFNADQTINGTLTLGAGTAAAYRKLLASDTIGAPRTLTCAAISSVTDVDFRDINFAGAISLPVTGTRLGDCKGNSNITFDAAKTVFWRQTATANWGVAGSGSWSATSGGAFDATQFPLAQDTAVFPAATYPTSGAVCQINAGYNIGTIDMSLRTTNTMNLNIQASVAIYGDWITGTGIGYGNIFTMTFAGRSGQLLTSAGTTIPHQIIVDSPSGSVTLQDDLVLSFSSATVFTITRGTFNAASYNVTLSGASGGVSSSNSNTRTIAIGSGTWTISGTNTWNAGTSTNLTVTGTGTISLTSASTKTFTGGALVSYGGITLNQGGAGTLTLSSNNTFANITNTYGSTGATTINLGVNTLRVAAFTAAGTAGNLLTITGTSAASPATLIYTGGGVISTVDYVVPTFVRAYPTTSTWFAGANSTNGGSLGWIFAASGGVIYAVFISESATALDSISATFGATTYLSNIAESNQAFDTFSALASFRSAASESARATDSVASNATLGSVLSETVNASDATSSNATMGSTVSDSVTVTDSAAAKQTFKTDISDTVNASDSIAGDKGLRGSIVEQATASETNAAKITFRSAASETARATDSIASRATMGSAVSDTARAADSAASTKFIAGNLSESVTAQDAAVSRILFPGSISESVTAQDTATAAQRFASSASESATAQDTVATTFQVGSAVSESARASDTVSSLRSLPSRISETATAQDSISSLRNLPGSVAESVTGLDSAVGFIRFPSSIAESATAQDFITPAVRVSRSVAESATASETVSSLRSLPGRISESATAQESVVAQAIFRGIIDEAVRGSDQFSTSVVFLAAFSEFAQAYAESVGYLTGSRSVSESSTASDTTAASKTLPGSISESARGVDQSVASLIWAVYISEQAAGLDSLNAPNSTYNARVADIVGVRDTPSTNAIFYAAVIAYSGVTDFVAAQYLWNLIDDTQFPNWLNVNNAQATIWTDVDDTQVTNWQNVNNTQSTTWDDIDDTQVPNWNPIE
jgi:hypothetical protein